MVGTAERKRLRAELRAAGVFEHREGLSWLKLGTMFGVLAGSVLGIVTLPTIAAVPLVVVAAIASTTAVMLGHEGCHRSFSKSPLRNALLTYIAFPLFAGLSASYWRYKHNALHHGHPNVPGGDPDVDIWPMASCRGDYERSGPLRRFFQRHLQGYAFWFLTAFMPTGMRVSSTTYLVREVKKRGLTRSTFVDIACLLAHYAAWIVVPALFWGLGSSVAFYVGVWALSGVFLGVIFSPGHIGLPLVEGQFCDWEHQLETTRNLRMPRWLGYFFVGLEHQIEHHLFPTIPHQNLGRARGIVRAWCRDVGLPHHEVGYYDALVSVTGFIAQAWRYQPRLGDELRRETLGRQATVDFEPRPRTSGGTAHGGSKARNSDGRARGWLGA